MLATLVIGLREGLEAALIVGIIAAFLRRNGRSLAPMWVGVGAALILSVAVGVILRVVEQSLPQAAQEGMESIIGLVAVFFVTTMIVWMAHHARGMKKELEAVAGDALREGTAWALAGMAFLAVLKEGFETSVFLLATFQASTDSGLAGLGAVLGILAAAAIGVGIYVGGVKLDLGRFFRYTGVFLLLVAAGLVLSTLHTAHEAGWIVAGQQRTIDLSWLAPNGSVQAALLTGVLGIPADPRLIEVVGWFAYLIPMALFMFWPQRRRPSGRTVPRLQLGVAAGLAVVAIVAAAGAPALLQPANRPLALAGGGQVRLVGDRVVATTGDGTTERFTVDSTDAAAGGGITTASRKSTDPVDGPATITAAELATANGGRIPVGIDSQRAPGPYTATWNAATTRTVSFADGVLLDARQQQTRLVTVSGGGLRSPRTVSVAGGVSWQVADAAAADAQAARTAAAAEQRLWGVQLPAALVVAALILAAFALRSRLRLRREGAPAAGPARIITPTAQNGTEAHAIH
ncbi:iron uptake transporter permease EfeU [Pseudolysinimonas sp.]|uniref:iron uptake transporter permease EfeU n=1 Tax=Pseudolysinimonas sp. TaxID=2680009 RepID=UPI003F7EBE0A